jgi:hypothetical protein
MINFFSCLFKSARKRIKVDYDIILEEKSNSNANDIIDSSLPNKQSSQSASSLALSSQTQMNARNERRSKRTRKCKGDIELSASSYNTVRQVKAQVSTTKILIFVNVIRIYLLID